MIGADRKQFGAFQQFVGVAKTLLLRRALFGDGWIFGRRFVVRRRPELVEARLDFGEARRDVFDAGVEAIGDWPDSLARGGEIGVDQIMAFETGLDVVQCGVRRVERRADAREVRGGRRRPGVRAAGAACRGGRRRRRAFGCRGNGRGTGRRFIVRRRI